MEKILVIDDEVGVTEILNEVLTEEGYSVDTFQNPEKALKRIQSEYYDVIITDLQMPKFSGLDIVKAAHKVSVDCEVIVITGHSSIESAIEAMKHGVYNYIHKPFNVSEIVITVNKAIEKIRLKKQNLELSRKVEKALADLTTLYEISKIINSSEEMDEIINFALGTIEASLDINLAMLLIHDEEKEEFFVKDSVGFTKKSTTNFKIQWKKGIIGQAIRDNEVVHVSDYKKDAIFSKAIADSDKKKIKNFCVIPLNAQNHLVGLITIHQLDESDQSDLEKLKLLEVMSVQIAPMIRLGQYNVERKLLITDPMSGGRSELMETIRKAGQYRGTLSVLIFKLYLKDKSNYGIKIFSIGDHVFDHIKNMITPIDSAVKIGMDSFMVVLQGKTKITTETIAAKIKKVVETDKFIKKNGILLDYGYADFPMDGTTFEDLVSKAQVSLWKFVKS